MKYFEVSQKISLAKDVSEQDLRQALLDRLQKAFSVGGLQETADGFQITIKTGSRTSMIKSAEAKIDAVVAKSQKTARFIVSGNSRISTSLMIWYSVLFIFLLGLGLVPGSIETGGENSGAMDVLVFLIFGLFLVYDIDKKLNEARDSLESALHSLDVEFG